MSENEQAHKVGDSVYWWYPKGWGGYIPATIWSIDGKYANIAIGMKDGSITLKRVKLEKLIAKLP